jgi:hypothetical protein
MDIYTHFGQPQDPALLNRHTTKTKTTGDMKNILVGRMNAFAIAVGGESPVDILDRYCWFPVDFRRRAAFLSRMTGAYVSFMNKKHATVTTPP